MLQIYLEFRGLTGACGMILGDKAGQPHLR